jgi:hypothetical protein
MNAKLCLVVAAMIAAVSAQAADERISVSQLPPAVRKTLDAASAHGPAKEIVRRVSNDGRVIYHIELEKNNAPNPHLRIAEDGTLVRDPLPMVAPEGVVLVSPEYADDISTVYRSTLKLEDLPAAAQQTVRAAAGGRGIADIDQEKWGGQTVYEVEFKQSGQNPQIHVAEDGALLRDERKRKGLKSLFLGTQLEDTPPVVQEAIRRVAGDREIADIDKRGPLGRPAYRVVLKSGSELETVHIGEDGQLLPDSRRGTPTPRRQ